MCVYACLFLVSAHYWAPTVLSPDGKPFDKKLIKVLLGLPTVNVLIIVLYYEDKLLVNLRAENIIIAFGAHFSFQQGPSSGGSNMFSSNNKAIIYSSLSLSLYIYTLRCHAPQYQTPVLVFHLAGCFVGA